MISVARLLQVSQLLVIPVVGCSQTDTISLKVAPSYIKSYWVNAKAMVQAPFKWKKDQWTETAGLTVFTGVLIPMDEVVNIPVSNWTGATGVEIGKTGQFLGNLPFQLGLSTAAIGLGYVTRNSKWRNFGLDNLQAQIFTGGITYAIKSAFHRARPYTGENNYAFYGPFHGGKNDSFISGHTSLTFCTATMLFLHSRKKWWVGAIGYTVATGVGISRMQQQKHWASDVIGGAIVGTVVASYVYKQQQKHRAAKHFLKPTL